MTLWEGNSPVIGEFPSQRPVTRSFDVFFNLRLNKWLNKHSRLWWFETPSRSLWCHCNVTTLTPLLVFPLRPYSTYHYNDVIMDAMASQITSISSVYSTICTSIDQRKHQSPASLACVRGIHWTDGEFPSQRSSKAENVSIWWRHHGSSSSWWGGWLLQCLPADTDLKGNW